MDQASQDRSAGRKLLAQLSKHLLPPNVEQTMRLWIAGAVHESEVRSAARAGMIPPRFMWPMVGGPDQFVEQGRSFSDYLIEHARLTPSSAVLDIGCGLGKHAIHLAPFLKQGGQLEGFDVHKRCIDWCQRAITPRYPNARFRHTPLKNDMYSPNAKASAADFKFPYRSDSFELAFLASVFTHMFTDQVDNYISEIARVLKSDGCCIATVYLLNESKRAGIAGGTAAWTFSIPRDGCWIETQAPPEAAVAYEERDLIAKFGRAGLFLAEPVRYGCWSETKDQDQDFLVLRKRS
jgi:SAM-dependent methyltransferase